MAGTNLLSVADKVLPTIIGVISFLGALLIVIGSVLYIISIIIITKKQTKNVTPKMLEDVRIKISLLCSVGTITLCASGICYVMTQINIIESKSDGLAIPIIIFYGCFLYAGAVVINNTRKH